jgi:hypothetical protein
MTTQPEPVTPHAVPAEAFEVALAAFIERLGGPWDAPAPMDNPVAYREALVAALDAAAPLIHADLTEQVCQLEIRHGERDREVSERAVAKERERIHQLAINTDAVCWPMPDGDEPAQPSSVPFADLLGGDLE